MQYIYNVIRNETLIAEKIKQHKFNIMNNVADFLNNASSELSKYDNLIETNSFGASEKFNDLWNNTVQSLYDKYSLPAFHIWETGFCNGDTDSNDIIEAVSKVNSIEESEVVSLEISDDDDIETNLFDFLDGKLLELVESDTKALIAEYENQFAEEFYEALSLSKENEDYLI